MKYLYHQFITLKLPDKHKRQACPKEGIQTPISASRLAGALVEIRFGLPSICAFSLSIW
ncbi:MAG: hypothetical protein JXQ90_23755 [Cyclobacteriaceae bacterium]